MKFKYTIAALMASVGLSAQPAFALQDNVSVAHSATVAECDLPDWLLTSGRISPNTVAVGGTVTINATIATTCPQNSGTAPTLGIYLVDVNGQPLVYFGEIPIALPNGARYTFDITIPQSVSAGNYLIALVSDHRQVVKESNENNNIATANLTVVNSAATQEEIAAAQEEHSLLPSSSGYVSYIDRSALSSDIFIGSGMAETKGMTVLDADTKAVDGLLK